MRFTNLANQFETSKRAAQTVFALIIMVIVAWFIAKMLDNTENGRVFGLASFAFTLPMAGAANFIALEMVMVIGFVCFLGLAWTFLGKKAG